MPIGNGAIQSSAHGYRRGLVLGLTMAEIVLLLLFSLLLALAAMFLQERDKFEDAISEREILKERVNDQELRINQLMAELERDDVGQMKKELVALKDTERKIEYLLERFKGEGSVPDRVSQLVEQLSKADKIADTLSSKGLSNTPEELAKELARLENAQEELAAADKTVSALEQQLDEVRAENSELKDSSEKNADKLAKLEQLQKELEETQDALANSRDAVSNAEQALQQREGQLANMKNTLERYGRGTEKPACWADEKTGKTKYIYDIELSNDGLAIHVSDIPPWAEARDLPIMQAQFKKVLTPQNFLAETKPIFDWSENNDCRFFVRAYDITGSTQKKLYKRHMRFLEARFYKYESLEPRQSD